MKPTTKARTAKKAPAKKAPARKAPASKPAANPKADETATAPASPPPVAPEVVTPPPAPPAPPVQPTPSASETTVTSEEVQIGNAPGVAQMVPLADVLGMLGQPVLDRVDALKGHASISTLAERMRGTDGRCAPVIFTEHAEGPCFYHGAEAIAAATALGVNAVYVITVPADAAEDLQGHLVGMAQQAPPDAKKG